MYNIYKSSMVQLYLQVVGVAYDGTHVYWTVMNFGYEAIYRSKIDGTDKEVNITIVFLLHIFLYISYYIYY